MLVRILSHSDSKGDYDREEALRKGPKNLLPREYLSSKVRFRTQSGGYGRPSLHGMAYIHRPGTRKNQLQRGNLGAVSDLHLQRARHIPGGLAPCL